MQMAVKSCCLKINRKDRALKIHLSTKLLDNKLEPPLFR